MTDNTLTAPFVTYLPRDPKTPNKVKALFNTTDLAEVQEWLRDNGMKLIYYKPIDGQIEVAFKPRETVEA